MKSSEAEDWHNFKRLKKLRSYTEFQLLRQLKLRCYSDLKFWKTGRPGAPQYSFLNYRVEICHPKAKHIFFGHEGGSATGLFIEVI